MTMIWDSVEDNEMLSRYIVYKRWVRNDKTVRQDAFMPPPNLQLSVTRQLGLDDDDIWSFGKLAVLPSGRTLYGRADIKTIQVRKQSLNVQPAPDLNNPNHAHIVNWPTNKDEQKMQAMELASVSMFLACP